MLYALGDHLKSPRFGYTHHAIYIGDGYVVENTREGTNLVSLEEFSKGHIIEVVVHKDRAFDRQESCKRALQCVGEDKYNLINYNCEHFVNWCINGKYQSTQVKNTVAAISSAAVVATDACLYLSKVKGKSKVASKAASIGIDALSLGTGTLAVVKVAKTALTIADTVNKATGVANTIKNGDKDLKTAIKIASVIAGFDEESSEIISKKLDHGLHKGYTKIKEKTKNLKKNVTTKVQST
ncbi:MAG: lecithin retinol acyltransferase family protein [Succinatimonas sp.]|nr:lecithin retinol acyltransferase family protein [Succinatimonas sp.]